MRTSCQRAEAVEAQPVREGVVGASRQSAAPACPAGSGKVGGKTAGPPYGKPLYGGALEVHGASGRLDLSAPVSYPSLAKTSLLMALQLRIVDPLAAYEIRRVFMRLHDYLRDEHRGGLTVEEFACLLVAAGYCRYHLNEKQGNDADGWSCINCEMGLPGVFTGAVA